MEIIFQLAEPFNFKSVVHSHGWYQLMPFNWHEDEEILDYILQLENGKVIEIVFSGIPNGLKVKSSRLSSKERKEVDERVRWMFGLDIDLLPFYKAIKGKPQLAHVKKKAMGRVLRSPTFFEDVVRTILTTNTQWSATKRMTANLVDQFGANLPKDPERKAFPTPAKLAGYSEEQLRKETRLGYRAPYILELAKRIESSDLDLESYKTSDLPTIELRKELLKIQGIGPYAAANLLLILGRSDFLPIDSWALKVVSHEWYNGEPVTPAHVQTAFKEWGQWQGLVYWFWDWKLFKQENSV